MDILKVSQTVDLKTGRIVTNNGNLFDEAIQGDSLSLEWEVIVLSGGTAANLADCTCVAQVVREDGATVPVAGTITGNVCTAILTAQCFAVVGEVNCFMSIMDANGDVIMTPARKRFYVRRGATNTVIDPGEAFPDLSFIIASMLWDTATVSGVLTVNKVVDGQYTVAFLDKTYTITCSGGNVAITE